MHPWLVFVRSINVGGRNRLKMPELRAALADAGLGQVSTYIQSGNVIVPRGSVIAESQDAVYEAIVRVLNERFGLDVEVVVTTAEAIEGARQACPFDVDALGDNKVYLAMWQTPPDPGASPPTLPEAWPEQVAATPHGLWLAYPRGMARSKLTSAWLERRLGVSVTARNWRTLSRVLDRAQP